MGWRSSSGLAGLTAAALLVPAVPPRAEEAPASANDDAIQRALEERTRKAESLKRIQDALAASGASRKGLEEELAAIGADRTKLNVALLDAARQAQATEDRLNGLEERLRTLGDSEGAIRKSLEARRGIIAEILAALQRMGRRPPPAVLVRPEDMLAVIRTSMLLGAVVPELRGEAETLAGDLAELVRLRGRIAADRESVKTDLASWAREKQRLDGLMEARRGRLAAIEGDIVAERQRASELGKEARSLKDLVDRMEGEVASARRAADEAKAAQDRAARETRERFANAGVRDPARLAPKIKFVDLRGEVPRPVVGSLTRGFNQPDGNGGTTRGVSMATRPKAVVSSPSDGWVRFAGPFRSYGRLLIIDAGDGYYLLLAGMDRIDVEVGQFVLAGEPVAAMGEGGAASAPARQGGDPVLYVEFKKDGSSIDPEPWWAKSPSEKVRG